MFANLPMLPVYYLIHNGFMQDRILINILDPSNIISKYTQNKIPQVTIVPMAPFTPKSTSN